MGGLGSGDWEDDDDKKEVSPRSKKFKEFDCPSCNANNPLGDPIGDGDEVLCNYCGTEYKVRINDEGKLKLKEM